MDGKPRTDLPGAISKSHTAIVKAVLGATNTAELRNFNLDLLLRLAAALGETDTIWVLCNLGKEFLAEDAAGFRGYLVQKIKLNKRFLRPSLYTALSIAAIFG